MKYLILLSFFLTGCLAAEEFPVCRQNQIMIDQIISDARASGDPDKYCTNIYGRITHSSDPNYARGMICAIAVELRDTATGDVTAGKRYYKYCIRGLQTDLDPFFNSL